MSESNGTVRSRKPQLADSIDRLDAMIDGLSGAIPGAVAESVREALGPALAEAIKEAVKLAVSEALKEVRTAAAAPPTPAPSVPSMPVSPPRPAPPKRNGWAKVRALLARVRRRLARTAAPVVARAALGWAVAKVIGGATVRSRAAALVTLLTGTAAGLVGFALGPVAAPVLLGLLSGSAAAVALWAAPMLGLFVALRDD